MAHAAGRPRGRLVPTLLITTHVVATLQASARFHLCYVSQLLRRTAVAAAAAAPVTPRHWRRISTSRISLLDAARRGRHTLQRLLPLERWWRFFASVSRNPVVTRRFMPVPADCAPAREASEALRAARTRNVSRTNDLRRALHAPLPPPQEAEGIFFDLGTLNSEITLSRSFCRGSRARPKAAAIPTRDLRPSSKGCVNCLLV